MSGPRVLRGQALAAVSPATVAAFDLLRVQGRSDEEARDLIDDAVANLLTAAAAALEAIGFEDGEDDRRNLYRHILDYNGGPDAR